MRDTLKYAKLTADDKENNENPDGQALDTLKNGTDPEHSRRGEMKVGSFVQWTSQGTHQFPQPLPIARIDERDGERFAYFEGKGHAPMSQLSIADPGTTAPAQQAAISLIRPGSHDLQPQGGAANERTTLDEGPVALTMPSDLSKESVSEFEYWVNGIVRRVRRKAGMPEEKDKKPANKS